MLYFLSGDNFTVAQWLVVVSTVASHRERAGFDSWSWSLDVLSMVRSVAAALINPPSDLAVPLYNGNKDVFLYPLYVLLHYVQKNGCFVEELES